MPDGPLQGVGVAEDAHLGPAAVAEAKVGLTLGGGAGDAHGEPQPRLPELVARTPDGRALMTGVPFGRLEELLLRIPNPPDADGSSSSWRKRERRPSIRRARATGSEASPGPAVRSSRPGSSASGEIPKGPSPA